MFDHLMPVWVNILFVLVAQTLIWVFLVSKLFASSANGVIRSINRCMKLGDYANPITQEDLEKTANVSIPPQFQQYDSKIRNLSKLDLSKSIEEIPEPTIEGNWDSIQKLIFCIVGALVLLAIMVVIAQPETRGRIGWYLGLSLVAYLVEVLFLMVVVVPYKHIEDVEIVYKTTKLEDINGINFPSIPPSGEIRNTISSVAAGNGVAL